MSNASDIAHDDKVFELSQALVRAVNAHRKAVKENGVLSVEAEETARVMVQAHAKLKTLQARDKQRGKQNRQIHTL